MNTLKSPIIQTYFMINIEICVNNNIVSEICILIS